jgi:uncharacterized LabA/DUF88 family protein
MKKMLMLIDAENISVSFIDKFLSGIGKSNDLQVKAYGDFENLALKKWTKISDLYGVEIVQQYNYVSGKNLADMALTIDAMELILTQKIESVSIFSSDSDFIPLVTKIRSKGILVFGVGQLKASHYLVEACDRYFFIDQEGKKKTETPGEKPVKNKKAATQKKKKPKEEPFRGWIKNALPKLATNNNQVELGVLGSHLSQTHNFKAKNTKFKTLKALVVGIGYQVQKLSSGMKVVVF